MSDLTINCRKSVDVQSHISSELLKGLGIDKRRGRRDDMISIESYQIESQLESMDFHINNIFYPESVSGPEHSDGSHWLGSYSSMQSPGV